MRQRPAQTPCLGDRVGALADGSLRPDVRDRALAHTLTCPDCRQALDVERLTVERLRSLPAPQPSARLMASLLALGEPGDPVPPRRGFGPGMPLPMPVAVLPAPPSPSGSVRPGGSTRPSRGGVATRRTRRPLVVVAAGALGAGFVAAGVLTSTVGASVAPGARTPVAQLTRDASSGTSGLATRTATRSVPAQVRFAPAALTPAVVVRPDAGTAWAAAASGGLPSAAGSAAGTAAGSAVLRRSLAPVAGAAWATSGH